MKIFQPELVAPAGDWSCLTTAVANGADSVYFGIKGMNMRHMAENFELSELKNVMKFLHKNGKKGYLAVNTMVMDSDFMKVKKILKAAKGAEVDAVILWDMAVFHLAKDMGLRIHLSTQASVSNFQAVKFYAENGARRIVLARECTLQEIKKIVQGVQKSNLSCEIETFIHGAMCISISGRCFLSEYSFGTSANKGQCWQPCRREYVIQDVEKELEYILGQDYVLSPKDLCSIDFIEELIKAGIHAFKIEGRMRAAEYIKETTSVYREAIDGHFAHRLTDSLKKRLKTRLKSVYHRGFSSGFYFGHPRHAQSRCLEHAYEKIFLGEVTRFFKKISVAEIRLRTRALKAGDQILLIGRTTPADIVTVQEMQCENEFVDMAAKGQAVGVKMPFCVKPKDKVFLWRRKADKNKIS